MPAISLARHRPFLRLRLVSLLELETRRCDSCGWNRQPNKTWLRIHSPPRDHAPNTSTAQVDVRFPWRSRSGLPEMAHDLIKQWKFCATQLATIPRREDSFSVSESCLQCAGWESMPGKGLPPNSCGSRHTREAGSLLIPKHRERRAQWGYPSLSIRQVDAENSLMVRGWPRFLRGCGREEKLRQRPTARPQTGNARWTSRLGLLPARREMQNAMHREKHGEGDYEDEPAGKGMKEALCLLRIPIL